MNHHQERNKIAAERRKLEEDKLQLKREREEFENKKKQAHLEREDHRNKMINFDRDIRRGTEFVTGTERRIHEEEQREQELLSREEVLKVELKAKLDRNIFADQILKRLHEKEEKEKKAQGKLERQAKAAEKRLKSLGKRKNKLLLTQQDTTDGAVQ